GLCSAFCDQGDAGTDLSWRAIAALKGIVIDECLLQRVEMAVLCQALDRGDARAVLHHGQHQARYDAAAVDQDSTGTTLAVITTLLGTGQVEMLAQDIEQRRSRVEAKRMLRPVHREIDRSDARGSARAMGGSLPFLHVVSSTDVSVSARRVFETRRCR